MQPDEGVLLDPTPREREEWDRIRAHGVTIGEPVEQAGRWSVAAFYLDEPEVMVVGHGSTRLDALIDLDRKLSDGG